MNKAGLIGKLHTRTRLSKAKTEKAVEIVFGEMAEALANGGRVEIRGLCSFSVKEYKGYTGRNPKTGEHAQVASKKLPFFKAGKELKEGVDR